MQEVGGSIPLTSTNFPETSMAVSLIRPDPTNIHQLIALYRECRQATDMAIVPEYFQALPEYVFSEKWETLFSGIDHKAKLAMVDTVMAGFYIVGPMDDYSENFHDLAIPDKCGELHQLYLLPQYQGKGLGKALYEDARKDLSNLGHAAFIACTYLENAKAKNFYSALGAEHLKDDVLGAPWHRPVTFFLDKT